MRRAFVIASLVGGAAILVGTAGSGTATPARSAEVARLQAHFDSVDTELRSRDVAGLSSSQLGRRALLTGWLKDYRRDARFPANDRFDTPTPFFRDKDGVLCAMAYLIDRSGRRDIVDKVAAARNNAYIAELADDPALIAWLDSSGLSVAEAARIQPAYGGFPDEPPRYGVRGEFALAALGFGSVSLASSTLNIVRPSYVSGLLGVVAGAASIAIGADHYDYNRATDRVATAVVGLGALSLGAGVYGLLEARRNSGDRDWDSRRGRGRRKISAAVVPDVQVVRSEPRMGLLLTGRF